jgi:hypothetical protein
MKSKLTKKELFAGPLFYLSADPDPDPGQIFKSRKVDFFYEKYI